ncbi:carnitine O-palmitoyltransferase 1, liver isoform-like isoform X2 [Orbicella faveolata]|uniref:carnitine O-palmitoyltransferase 1, liver isoform-like isoform X2 n=2 Tax=Orbicella faveolata TaxID=48498 RepID=UPI0009E38F7A|nr:carnitine O-palmitoyltransferase 1, liver isoform-like isoform X2 [Orbicella faveolata]
MAEARLGVAFQFQVTEEGIFVNIDRNALKFVGRAMMKSAKRRVKGAKKAILKRSFPATPATWILLVAALSAARYTEHETTLGVLGKLERGMPWRHSLDPKTVIAVAVLLCATILWMLIGHIHQFTLRQLLRYRAFLYEPRGKLSLKTKCWLGLVKLLGGKNPTLYSYEKSLPYLPVPDLEATTGRYLESVRPVLSEERFKEMEKLAVDFKDGLGKKLQRYLVWKSWWSSNYISDWWQQFVYLRSREPLMINSNYYGVDSLLVPSQIQSARAANMIHALFLYRKQIFKEKLEPQFAMGIIPLCSEQFRRTFNTTRIPLKEQDHLHHHGATSHTVIYHRGRFFRLEAFHRGVLLKPADLERQILKILQDESKPVPGEELLPAMTSADRNLWAETRSTYFSTGVNRQSLGCIEDAAVFLNLEDLEMNYGEEESEDLDSLCRYLLHGNGHSCWFDKSFSAYIFKNGRFGLTAEHSWADAPIVSHLGEYVLIDDVQMLGYKEDGHCKGEPEFDQLPSPTRLQWDIPEKCVSIIESCQKKAELLINDLDLHVLVHTAFGKGVIKKCRLSPDAFIQMGLQLAYFKDQQTFSLTYESSMTRLFREGRTETVRPCTTESCSFVRAMLDPSATKSVKKELLVKAAEAHVDGFRRAMAGQGVDRHLFGLYVVSRYLEEDSPFLKEALKEPWKLSTSQTATQQTKKTDYNKYPEQKTAGGGFGPVADDGYGVSYIIAGEDIIFYHITCKVSSQLTDTKRFSEFIKESMAEMKALFE